MKRLKIDEFAASMLDDTIQKGREIEERDLLKSKQKRQELRKALSHNPFKPHDMGADSPYYNPYKMDEMGTGWMPHDAESWYDMGKRPEIDNYLTVKQFYGQKIDLDQTMNRFSELRRSIDKFNFDIVKAEKAPIGTVHTYQDGQRYKKFGEGDWRPLGGLETSSMRDRLGHKDHKKNAVETLEGHYAYSSQQHKDIESHASKTSAIKQVLDRKKREEELKGSVKKESMESLRSVLEKMHGGKLPPELEEHFNSNKFSHLDEKLANKVKRKGKGEGHEVHLSKQDLQTLLKSGKFALISAGKNPQIKEEESLDDTAIGQRYESLRGDLKDGGYAFTKITGHYGGEEDSFLVMIHDHDEDHILELGKKYNQDSVILADGGKQKMIYTTGKNEGKAHEGEGYSEVGDDQKDFYSEYKTSDGQIFKWSQNFEFDNLVDHKPSGKDQKNAKLLNTTKKPDNVISEKSRPKKKVGISWEDVANAYKSLSIAVEEDCMEENLFKGAPVPVGTIHTYKDGMEYKKVSEGKWMPVSEGRGASTVASGMSSGKKEDHLERVESIVSEKLKDKKDKEIEKQKQPKKEKPEKPLAPKDAGKPDNDMGPPPPENEAFVKPGKDLTEEDVTKFLEHFKKDFVDLQVLGHDLKSVGADNFGNRLKDSSSLLKKMKGRLGERSLNTVTDAIGARALASDSNKQKNILKHMIDSYEMVEVENFSDKGRPDGYRAIHLLFKTDNGKICELQIKTHRQQVYSGFTHDTIYKTPDHLKHLEADFEKAEDGRPKNREVAQYLNDLSDYLSALDKGEKDIPEKRPVEPKILAENGVKFPWNELEKIDKGDYSTFKKEEDDKTARRVKEFERANRGKVKHFVIVRDENKQVKEIKEFDSFAEANKSLKKEKGAKGEKVAAYSDSKEELLKVFSEYRPQGWDGE